MENLVFRKEETIEEKLAKMVAPEMLAFQIRLPKEPFTLLAVDVYPVHSDNFDNVDSYAVVEVEFMDGYEASYTVEHRVGEDSEFWKNIDGVWHYNLYKDEVMKFLIREVARDHMI